MIVLASLFVDVESRARRREQWLADLEGAAEAGIAPSGVALGVLRAVPSINPHRGASMSLKPIGPLAIALRHTNAGQRQVAIIAALSVMLLAVGIGLLA
ncbi:hypothetical protein NBCG_04621 [Nocardioidaceae bacterium Broad-1]|nr:hypothetical protein NBCG_04621 [Nocardioidaceae bacterium Broad-1]